MTDSLEEEIDESLCYVKPSIRIFEIMTETIIAESNEEDVPDTLPVFKEDDSLEDLFNSKILLP